MVSIRGTKNIAQGMQRADDLIAVLETNGKRQIEVLLDDKLARKEVLAFHVPRRPRTPTQVVVVVDDDDHNQKLAADYRQVDSSAAASRPPCDIMIVNNPTDDDDQVINTSSAFPDCRRTTDRILLFRKKLTQSDTTSGQSRLKIPPEGVRLLKIPLITEADKDLMQRDEGLPVTLMCERNSGRMYEVRLRYWPSSGAHVLKQKWMEFVRENGLKNGDEVEVSGFRFLDTGRVCFLLKQL